VPWSSRASAALLATLSGALAPARLDAQSTCTFGPDGFDGNGVCCPNTGQEAQVPDFPDLLIDGRALAFDECVRDPREVVSIDIQSPVRVNCDHFRIDVTVVGGLWSFTGSFLAKYSRTWVDFDSVGNCRQRWRFLLNTDVSYTFDNDPPYPYEGLVPHCVLGDPAYTPHYTGHIDYMCDASSAMTAAIALHHLPGCISHDDCSLAPAVSAGSAHPEWSYHVVGPLPFSYVDPGSAFATAFTLNQAGAAEAVRESRPPFSNYACLREARLGIAQPNELTPQEGQGQLFCPCTTIDPNAPENQERWTFVSMFASFECADDPTSGIVKITSQDLDPVTSYCPGAGILGPFVGNTPGLITMRVGSWTGGPFAGEDLHIFFGRMRHVRYHPPITALPLVPCGLPLDPSMSSVDVDSFVHGVLTVYPTTRFGRLEPFPGDPSLCDAYDSMQYDRFFDLANMAVPSVTLPDIDGYGIEFYSWIVWNLNPVGIP
jgi:hypothetical protein